MPDSIDLRTLPYVNIVDRYTKEGKHLSERATTPDGMVLWESGRKPSKDVKFFPVDLVCRWLDTWGRVA
jgi:hypothetical protein